MSTPTDNTETIYIGCQCHAPEHIVRVSYFDWKGKDMPELYMELQAHGHLSFWNRLKMGVKFILGRATLEWHDVIPNHDDAVNLHRILTNYIKDYKLWEKVQTNGK